MNNLYLKPLVLTMLLVLVVPAWGSVPLEVLGLFKDRALVRAP